jgi:hypothetical protein
MTRKCDFCRLDIQCHDCEVLGASADDHWHTCDLSCAHELRALVREDETPKEYRQRSMGGVRPMPYSSEEFEYLLCDDCLAIWNDKNEIARDEMCADCRATFAIRDNPSAMKALKDAKVKL